MNFKRDIEINENELDIEWLNQPKLALKYGKYWAQCSDRLTRAVESLKLIKAELTARVVENPERYLGAEVKVTNPIIEAYVRNHKKHKAAKEEWLEAKYEFEMADIAKWQISNSRKDALENLVKLHGQQYFAGPAMPRDLNFEIERKKELQQQSNEGISKKLKRTKIN